MKNGVCAVPATSSGEYLAMTDAMGKSTFDVGSYDLCMETPSLNYCLMNAGGVVFGVCVPAACNMPADYLNFTTGLFFFFLGEVEFLVLLDPEDATFSCGNNVQPWTAGSYIVAAVLVGLAVLLVVGSAAYKGLLQPLPAVNVQQPSQSEAFSLNHAYSRRQGMFGRGGYLADSEDEDEDDMDRAGSNERLHSDEVPLSEYRKLPANNLGGLRPAPYLQPVSSAGRHRSRLSTHSNSTFAQGVTASPAPGSAIAVNTATATSPAAFGHTQPTPTYAWQRNVSAGAGYGGRTTPGAGSVVQGGGTASAGDGGYTAAGAAAQAEVKPIAITFESVLSCFSLYSFSADSKKMDSEAAGGAAARTAAAGSSSGAGRLDVVDGVRALSLLWMALGQTLLFMTTPGIINWNSVLPPNGAFGDVAFQVVPSAWYAADSFLLLSGFFAVRSMLRATAAADASAAPGSNQGRQAGSGSGGGGGGGFDDSASVFTFSPPAWMTRQPRGMSWAVAVSHVLKRISRIVPLYALVLGLYMFVLPQLGSGPFWNALQPYTQACNQWWWTNLAFVNSYLPASDSFTSSCMPWTWYLSVDMQLHLVAPVLVYLYLKHHLLGSSATSVLLVASIVTTEEIASVSSLSAIVDFQLALGETLPNSATMAYYDSLYTKMWARAPPFLLGMLLAFVLDRIALARERWQLMEAGGPGNALGIETFVDLHSGPAAVSWPPYTISPLSQRTLILLAALIMGACVYSSAQAYSAVPSPWSDGYSLLYTVLTRPAWAFALGLILFVCLTQDCAGDVAGWLLSWKLWRPLAVLAYPAFLLNVPIIQLVYYNQTDFFRYSTITFIVWYSATLTLTLAVAVIAHVALQRPLRRLERLLSAAGTGSTLHWLCCCCRGARGAAESSRSDSVGSTSSGSKSAALLQPA